MNLCRCRTVVCQRWEPVYRAEWPSSMADYSSLGLGYHAELSRPSSHGSTLYIPLEKMSILYFQSLQLVKADLDFKSCYKIKIIIVTVA